MRMAGTIRGFNSNAFAWMPKVLLDSRIDERRREKGDLVRQIQAAGYSSVLSRLEVGMDSFPLLILLINLVVDRHGIPL